MPSWMLVFLERVAEARAAAGRPVRTVFECWPNLKVFVHGGVSFAPYASVFDEWLGRRLERIEVYPASEAFVAIETERGSGLTLALDHGVFYEFVPVEGLGAPRPRRHTVGEVELERPYAVAVTTPAGLWSCLLGDTVRFVARDPLRLAITGRVRHCADAFGESDRRGGGARARGRLPPDRGGGRRVHGGPALPVALARAGRARLALRVPGAPAEPEVFARVLDETLCALNAAYRTKRWRDVGMAAPRVVALPRGTVHK